MWWSFGCSAAAVVGWTVWMLPFSRKIKGEKSGCVSCLYIHLRDRVFIHNYYSQKFSRQAHTFLDRAHESVFAGGIFVKMFFPLALFLAKNPTITRRCITFTSKVNFSRFSTDRGYEHPQLLRRQVSSTSTRSANRPSYASDCNFSDLIKYHIRLN